MATPSNPYKFAAPLNPETDRQVCIPREKETDKICDSINNGSFWYVTGPAHIGKSTFLNLVRHRIGADHYHIHIDLSRPVYQEENVIYRDMAGELLNAVPPGNIKKNPGRANRIKDGFDFYSFLTKLRIDDGKKVVFLLDEIDSLTNIKQFLALWRKMYTERYDKSQFNRYILVLAGSANLIKKTVGPNSPFNIAEILFLPDFSREQSRQLIEFPLNRMGMSIDKRAEEKIWREIQGHPQLTQNICFLVAADVIKSRPSITVPHVEHYLEHMLDNNVCLDALAKEVDNDTVLKKLLTGIINGESKPFLPYKEYAVSGTGAIKEIQVDNEGGKKEYLCVLRNPLFEKFLITRIATIKEKK